jgi:hypothetical protein
VKIGADVGGGAVMVRVFLNLFIVAPEILKSRRRNCSQPPGGPVEGSTTTGTATLFKLAKESDYHDADR